MHVFLVPELSILGGMVLHPVRYSTQVPPFRFSQPDPSNIQLSLAADVPPTVSLRAHALQLLRASLGDSVDFRDGQWEAIESLVTSRDRLLVVQRTGWGKSSVYFLTTRLLRERAAGPTILISPLLALMRDQIRAAERIGLVAATINSTNTDEWDEIAERVRRDEIDLLLVSPERLANARFRSHVIDPILSTIGMLVVDEAHCISDWGHDFRPDYRRIQALLPKLGADVAVLATTATANAEVAADVVTQLGGSVRVIRGPLSRASLSLQTIHIESEHERMAWLARHLPYIHGSGIIYVLTKAHARRIAAFLVSQGIDAASYTGGSSAAKPGSDDASKRKLEQRLLNNEIKAIVATPALGMGFDKPDLAFVIHFQMPQSLIHYYQQVGRAGRAVDDALGVLLHGEIDKRITNYFIAQAFPPEAVFHSVLRALAEVGASGASVTALAKQAKVGRALTEKVLGQLAVEEPPPVQKRGSIWSRTGTPFTLNTSHFAELTARRHREQDRITDYARGTKCLMMYVAEELDDPTAQECGKCSVCIGRPLVPRSVPAEFVDAAANFVREDGEKPARKRATKKRRKRTPKLATRTIKAGTSATSRAGKARKRKK